MYGRKSYWNFYHLFYIFIYLHHKKLFNINFPNYVFFSLFIYWQRWKKYYKYNVLIFCKIRQNIVQKFNINKKTREIKWNILDISRNRIKISIDKYIDARPCQIEIINQETIEWMRGKQKNKERTHPLRRSPNPIVARQQIVAFRRYSGVVAIPSTDPRAPTSNHPLPVPESSQGAPPLRTIDSHGAENRVARSKGRSTGMTRARRRSGWSRDGAAFSSVRRRVL